MAAWAKVWYNIRNLTMKRLAIFCFACLALADLTASWYWPFGDDDEQKKPRLSELMEPASLLIDDASDLASEGKISESVEKYRAALAELDRIEAEDPERAKAPEFATLRTKRAYVGAAIDSLLLVQARSNAKPVAVSDTTELEKKLAEERNPAAKAEAEQAPERAVAKESEPQVEAKAPRPTQARKEPTKRRRPSQRRDRALSPKERVMNAIGDGDYAEADRIIASMLSEKPNNAMALNLKAARLSAEGRYRDAERALDQAIHSNPRSHFAYGNMATLILKSNPKNIEGARRYYETGRALGGPENAELEAAFAK